MYFIYLCLSLIIIFLAYVIYFYRRPDTIIRKNDEDNVWAPSYGKIMDIIYKNNTIHIPIFLSPFDIHYQVFPISGELVDVKYDATGKYELAYNVNKSKDNEKAIHTLVNKHGEFKVYQIAGLIARRIEWYNNPIKHMDSGELLGIIHLGSRVDIFIPNADKFTLLVKKDECVQASKTLIGYFE